MKRDDDNALQPQADGRIVHLVGSVNDEVYRFLCPATRALARTGVEQVVVMVDHTRYRRYLPSFPESVELVLSLAHRHPFKRWKAVMQAYRDVLAQAPTRAVHLHGLLPCLVGAFATRSAGVAAPILHSPHGVRLASLLLALRPVAGASLAAPVPGGKPATSPRSMELVEGPIHAAFFAVERNEARHPLIVGASRRADARLSESFAQLAVLIGGEELRVAFNWIGPADDVSCQRFKAANVGVFDATTAAERASRLASGWVHVCLHADKEFPVQLAEAMAAGMPCVAIDHPRHRALVRHGDTGLLYRTPGELLQALAHLIDTPAARRQLGEAAREEALRRFSEHTFQERLLAAYRIA